MTLFRSHFLFHLEIAVQNVFHQQKKNFHFEGFGMQANKMFENSKRLFLFYLNEEELKLNDKTILLF